MQNKIMKLLLAMIATVMYCRFVLMKWKCILFCYRVYTFGIYLVIELNLIIGYLL